MPPKKDRMIIIDPERCTGCRDCEMVCSLSHFGVCDPDYSLIRIYPGSYAFARVHFFDTYAVSFGKTMRNTGRDRDGVEIIEQNSGEDYLRIILIEGMVSGAQAVGRPADSMGLLIAAMWRRENLGGLIKTSGGIAGIGSSLCKKFYLI